MAQRSSVINLMVLICFLFSACGGGGNDNGPSSGSSTTPSGAPTNSTASGDVAPSITTQPDQVTKVGLGNGFELTVAAKGSTLFYQWYQDGKSLGSAATNASYRVTSMTAFDAGTYSVKVSNSVGVVESAKATVRLSTPSPYSSFRPGEEAWNMQFHTNPLPSGTPSGVSWLKSGPGGKSCLTVTSPVLDRTQYYGAKIPVDLTSLRGAQVVITCGIRAQNVTQPVDAFNGVKVMFELTSPSQGIVHINPQNVYGSFDWQDFTIAAEIPSDITTGLLYFGLQGSGGTAWLSEITITVIHPALNRPAIDPKAAPLVRDHVPMRGVTIPPVVRANDFPDLSTWHANVVRWMMQPDQDPKTMSEADYDNWIDSAIVTLDKALASARTSGLKLVVELYAPPGGRDDDGNLRMLFDESLGNQYLRVWAKLAAHYKENPAIFAFGLINEPVQTGYVPDGLPDWLELQAKAAYVVRAIDPATLIMFATDGYDSPDHFTWMPVVNIPGIIYEAHMYYPHSFTHQGVKNTLGGANGDPLVSYPGTVDGTPTGTPLNKDALIAYLQPLRDFQIANRVQVYIGEFSAARWASGAPQYLKDVCDILEGYGWDWTYHAFRGSQCWDLEMADLPYDMNHGSLATTPTDRMQVVRQMLKQNTSPY